MAPGLLSISNLTWNPIRIKYQFVSISNPDETDFIARLLDITANVFGRYLLVQSNL